MNFSTKNARATVTAMQRFARDAGAQSVLELAAAAPFLIILLVATFEGGRFMYDGIEVGNAARAGVQYGAQSIFTKDDVTGIDAAVFADAPEIALATTNVTATSYCTCDSSQGSTIACPTPSSVPPCPSPDRLDYFVKVTVSKPFTPYLSYPGFLTSLTVSKTEIQEISP